MERGHSCSIAAKRAFGVLRQSGASTGFPFYLFSGAFRLVGWINRTENRATLNHPKRCPFLLPHTPNFFAASRVFELYRTGKPCIRSRLCDFAAAMKSLVFIRSRLPPCSPPAAGAAEGGSTCSSFGPSNMHTSRRDVHAGGEGELGEQRDRGAGCHGRATDPALMEGLEISKGKPESTATCTID